MGKIILFFIGGILFNCSAQNRGDVIYQIKNVTPIMEGFVNDSVYSKVVNDGLNSIPFLIENLTNGDTITVKGPSQMVTIKVKELSAQLIQEIIHDSTLSACFKSISIDNDNAQTEFKDWYEKNKHYLKFVRSKFQKESKTPSGKIIDRGLESFYIIGYYEVFFENNL